MEFLSLSINKQTRQTRKPVVTLSRDSEMYICAPYLRSQATGNVISKRVETLNLASELVP